MTCPDCRQDTLRDAAGKCLWCHPVVLTAMRYCDECDALLERPVHNQRFCGLACKRKHWDRTDRGRAWELADRPRRYAVRRERYAQQKAAS